MSEGKELLDKGKIEEGKKNYLSHSRMNMYLRCPKQFEFRYMKGLTYRPSGAMTLGGAWHQALEINFNQKKETRQDIKLSDMKEVFSDRFDTKVKEEDVNFEDDKPSEIKDKGLEVTEIHHREIAPKIQPVHVEMPFTIPLTEENDLHGFIDVIDEEEVIVEHKSAKTTPNDQSMVNDMQLTVYSKAYRKIFGKEEKGIRKDTAVKTKTPKMVSQTTTRGENDFDILLQIAHGVEAGIKTGAFAPNPNGWHCSPKYCGFWDRCMGKKKPSTGFSKIGTGAA